MLAMAAGRKLGGDYSARYGCRSGSLEVGSLEETIVLAMAAGRKLGGDYSARYGCRLEAWRRL